MVAEGVAGICVRESERKCIGVYDCTVRLGMCMRCEHVYVNGSAYLLFGK